MNPRPDMLRQQPGMLNPQFMAGNPQSGPQHHPMNMAQNGLANHAPFVNGQPNTQSPMMVPRFPNMPIHPPAAVTGGIPQPQQQAQRLFMRGQPNPPPGNMSGSPMGQPPPSSASNMGFPPQNLMTPGPNINGVRRMPPQGNIPPGQQQQQHMSNMGNMAQGSAMGIGMNQQSGMSALRPTHSQPSQMRPLSITGGMPDVGIAGGMSRQNGNPMNPNLRPPSAPAHMMNPLGQQQQPGGGQPTMTGNPQHGFQGQMHQNTPHPPSQPQGLPQGPSPAHSNRPASSQGQHMPFSGFPGQFGQPPINGAHGNNPQFSFPTSPPSNPMNDLPQGMSNGVAASNRSSFHPTPTQIEQLNLNGDPYNNAHFNMAPPPAQQHNPHNFPAQHTSPQESMGSYPPPRPPSQTQSHTPRPASRGGPSQTPRLQQAHAIPNPGSPHIRPPSSHAHQGSHPQGMPHTSMPMNSQHPQHPQLAPRPPMPPQQQPTPPAQPQPSISQPGPPKQVPPSHPGPGPVPDLTNVASLQPPSQVPNPPVQQKIVSPPLGNGQGLIRLLQFSGNLGSENPHKFKLSWWKDLMEEYFTPKALMRFTLWKDNQRSEAKLFDISVPVLPRFFLVTTQSGVRSMTLTLDGARERMFASGHSVVECVTAVWTYKYTNGYTVTLRGPMTVHVVITTTHPPGASPPIPGAIPQPGSYTLKFEDFQFDANHHEKYISSDAILGPRLSPPVDAKPPVHSPTPADAAAAEEKMWDEPRLQIENASIPGEPVNAFGIPQATMRCLELAESVGQMTELITFATTQNIGPIDALQQYAAKLFDQGHRLNTNPGFGTPIPFPGMQYPGGPMQNGAAPGSALYANGPHPQLLPPGLPHPGPSTSPENSSMSPHKQYKPMSQQNGGPSGGPSTSTPPATPTTSNTSTTTTGKRKASNAALTSADSPDSQPASNKRMTRKRGKQSNANG